jgi:multicomponent K+:H+ antiporter subunit A
MGQQMPGYLIFAVIMPVLAGLVTLLIPRKALTLRVLISAGGHLLSFGLIACHLSLYGLAGADQATMAIPWIPSLHLDISFLADGLGAFFALLISGVGTLIVFYARGYFGRDQVQQFRFFPTLGFFSSAMMGVVLSDHMLLTVLFWELTSISSFLLIGWERDNKHAVKLAMQAFFTTGMGGLAMFGGILLLGETTGIWRWSELLSATDLNLHDGRIIGAFVLIFLGAATKSAQWPFHYWLPGAMAAPTPVSAYLHSATMVKAGVFLMARIFPVFGHLDLWPWLAVGLGTITMILGAGLALYQYDLKRIFAYTTVSQLGLLFCMYGLGSLGPGAGVANWDITQIANHAFYKAPLFIVAGAIGHVAGTRRLPRLFGLWSRPGLQTKAMVVVILLAGYALAGGPGTVSFTAKELFLSTALHCSEVHWIFTVVTILGVLTALCNVAIFVRLLTTLLGLKAGLKETVQEHPEDGYGGHGHEHEHETGFWSWMLWLPAAVIVSFQYIGGLIPPVWNGLFHTLEAGASGAPIVHWLWHPLLHPEPALALTALAILGGVAVGLSHSLRGAVVDIHDRIYPTLYFIFVRGGGVAFRLIQTGNIRHYIVFTLIALFVGVGGAVFLDPAMLHWPDTPVLESWPAELLLGVITCMTALMMPIVHQRVVRVLVLGSCGFSVVGMYLIYQAPDLALTQLMFEIISVILFLLVLRLLPKQDKKRSPNRAFRAVFAATAGLIIGWMTLIAAHHADTQVPENQKLGTFFKEHSKEGTLATHSRGGGGGNIVNVILVDFRGFDTLGEITVLGIAALGVWSLLPGKKKHKLSNEVRT